MKISIITTTFNAETFIEETLESVLSQRGNFYIEYLVYDSNSTDSTYEIIKKYKNLVDSGFYKGRNCGIDMQIYQEKDNGMYDGISKGFQKATGDIVAYINGDDFYLPNAFSCVCEVFNKYNQINWLMGTITTSATNGIINYTNTFNNFCKKFIKKGIYGNKLYFIQQESCFWRKELLNLIDYNKFKTFNLAGDFYLWQCFASSNMLYTVEANLSCFRYRKGQKSENIDKYHKEMFFIIENSKLSVKEKCFIYYIKHLAKFSNSINIFGNKVYFDCEKDDWLIAQKTTKLDLLKINIWLFINCFKLLISLFFI